VKRCIGGASRKRAAAILSEAGHVRWLNPRLPRDRRKAGGIRGGGHGGNPRRGAGDLQFAAQAIKCAAEIGWKPVLFLASISNSVGSVLRPAGLEASTGVLSTNYLKDATDPTWKDDPATKEWIAFMDKYFPEGDRSSTFSVYGYLLAQTMVQVLKQCGDEPTRENVMKQAANLKDLELGMLLPGIRINTSPTDYFPVEQMQMSRFNGDHGDLFGSVISGEIGTQ
jgi:branched-chain amino acid transport system substrate-binding protein